MAKRMDTSSLKNFLVDQIGESKSSAIGMIRNGVIAKI